MIRLIRRPLGLCDHQWKIHCVADVRGMGDGRWTDYHLQCTKCGNMKKWSSK